MSTAVREMPEGAAGRRTGVLLLATVFVLAICGLVYELVVGTLSSYLLGDSIKQFSLVIGLFLTAMGIGSWLSRFITGSLAAWFVAVELAVGVLGGFAALVGFAAFTFTEIFEVILYGNLALVGMLVGLEIPLMIRLLRELDSLRVTVANVLSVDYVGAFAASLMFPFLLVPHLGLVRAGLVMGVANVAVAALFLRSLGAATGRARRPLMAFALLALVALAGTTAVSGRIVRWLEDRVYGDEIILAKDSPYQRIVITRWRDDIRLYLNGHLQFSTVDEYRYHEALVHPAMSLAERRDRVLVLGGGDGMAVREVLRWPSVKSVDLVDLDGEVTDLFTRREMLAALNDHALSDPRVSVHNTDAMRFLAGTAALWDVIIMDLPDPGEVAVAKLYSRPFFKLAGRHLAAGGMLVTQATSPFRSREAFWCIAHTLEAARWGPDGAERLHASPYHTVVPTFGTWGFIVASRRPPRPEDVKLPVPTRYLREEMVGSLFTFPADMAEIETPVSELDAPVVARLYRNGYHRYLE